MSEFIAVKNFERFQHYKDRRPPWIKLYNELLDDYEFCALPDASKWLAVGLWLLASRHNNRIRNDAAWIGRMVHASTAVDLAPLLTSGFIYHLDDASETLAKRQQTAPLRARARETETERDKESSPVISVETGNGADARKPTAARQPDRGLSRIVADARAPPQSA